MKKILTRLALVIYILIKTPIIFLLLVLYPTLGVILWIFTGKNLLFDIINKENTKLNELDECIENYLFDVIKN